MRQLLFMTMLFLSFTAKGQIKTLLQGTQDKEFLGTSIATNKDGSIIAVGSPYANKNNGYASVYRKDANRYIPLANHIINKHDVNIGERIFINNIGDLIAFTSKRYENKQWNSYLNFY